MGCGGRDFRWFSKNKNAIFSPEIAQYQFIRVLGEKRQNRDFRAK